MRKYRIHRSARPTTTADFHSPEVFFDGDFWETNWAKFALFARRRIATLPWYGRFNSRPSGGHEPNDYVLRAAALLMDGTRRCRREYAPLTCVYGVIDSLISNDAAGLENSYEHDFISQDRDEAAPIPLTGPSIEETLAAQDQLEKYKACFDDERHQRYLDLVAADEHISAADAAAALGISVSEVRAIVKVVRRRRGRWPGKPPA